MMRLLAANTDEMTGGDLLAADESMPRGTIYTTLQRMEKKGLTGTRTEWIDEGPRRYYWLTEKGLRVLKAYEAFERACRDG